MQNTTSKKKRLSATVYYLLTGIVMGWPGLLATGILLPAWQRGVTFSPLSLAVIHLFALGSMLTIAFGVLYQIVPIAFRAPPIPRHVLYWHLPLHILSVITMIVGFLFTQSDVVGFGGGLLLCSAVAYFTFIARSYIRAQNKTRVHKALSLPFASLWLVILFGIFQALYPSQVSEYVILTHIRLGGFALWGGLVLVFSYKLVPMFSISHGYKASLPRSASSYFIGVLFLIVSSWIPGKLAQTIVGNIGDILILLGLLSFTVDMFAIIRARKRRKLVLPVYDSLLASMFFVIGQVGLVLSVLIHTRDWIYPLIYLFAFGGLMGLIFSYVQKIVPFLWFEYRFSKRPERKIAPLIDDMVPKRTAQFGMVLYFLGTLAGFVRLWGYHFFSILDWGSAICLTVGSILLFMALRHVLTIGGTRPPDEVA